jgi:hypothetical protein
MLSFGFTPTKSDYIKSFRAFYLSNWKILAFLIFVSVPQVICIFSALIRGEFGYGFGFAIPITILLFLCFLAIYALLINPLMIANKIEKDERLHSSVQYEVTDEQLLFRNQFAETKLDWGSFQKFIETKDLFLIVYTVNKNMFQIIPKRAFTSSEDEQSFRNLLNQKIPKEQIKTFDFSKLPVITIILIAILGFLLCYLPMLYMAWRTK